MSSVGKPQPPGKQYWRSLDDVADTPEFREFMHREFPAGASEWLDGADRRHFLKIMGASMALAGMGLSGCRRWPQEQIAPFANRPAGRTPGIPRQFASAFEMGGVAQGVLVTSYDGRPIKVEGNPEHPVSRGGTDLFTQASILDLYDPDRSRIVLHNGAKSTWGDFQTFCGDHFGRYKAIGGDGLAVLSEASASPSVTAMRRRFQQAFPAATWHEYESINDDQSLAGSRLAFGTPHRTHHDFARARVVVSLDADFLGTCPGAAGNIRDFASARRAEDMTMSRLYVFEAGLSLTGANADERERIRCGDVSAVAAWLARRILQENALGAFEGSDAGHDLFDAGLLATLEHAVSDLEANHGASIVIAGDRQPAEVHYLAHLMNVALGNRGNTVTFTPAPDKLGHTRSLADLVGAINAGNVSTLLIIGGNPVYNAPADLDVEAAIGSVADTIHLGAYVDETATHCTWHLNRAHPFESWGDGRAQDGTYTIQQPVILPLFGDAYTPNGAGKSTIELMATLLGDPETAGMDIVRRTFAETTGSDDDAGWKRTLHDGFLAGSAWAASAAVPTTNNRAGAIESLFDSWTQRDRAGWEITFAPDPTLYDGRFANNGWLQELPDPVTKLTWDNAAILSPASAAELGVATGDLVTIASGGFTVEAPALVVPGLPDRCVQLNLGYGRAFAGSICTDAGFNFGQVRSSTAMGFAAADVRRASGSYPLAMTQDHHAIDVENIGGQGIQQRLPTLVREATLDEYKTHPQFVEHRNHVTHRLSLFTEDHDFHTPDDRDGSVYAWGMTIDLSTCVGCNSCLVACQAENNIPIVGKDQVMRGREMHWIRIDRYFTFEGGEEGGTPDVNRLRTVALQPVACVHCENAPCEQVCPVAATTHDDDGLNVMVYNRCVGTRYCSNNCPYKVRRFNYFDYHRRGPGREDNFLQVEPDYYTKRQADAGPLKQMQFNPDVTVRMRGVMEKCTYCIQRIRDARITAKNEWVGLDPAGRPARPAIVDGSFTTACAQACPARAITFGDLNDNASQVAQLQQSDRSYEMLDELNIKPRTQYLAKLRNPAASESHNPQPATEAPSHG